MTNHLTNLLMTNRLKTLLKTNHLKNLLKTNHLKNLLKTNHLKNLLMTNHLKSADLRFVKRRSEPLMLFGLTFCIKTTYLVVGNRCFVDCHFV